MNLIDAQVVEVMGGPVLHEYDNRQYYTVPVKYVDMDGEGIKNLVFNRKEDALKIKKGYKFQH